jgi:UDP-glucose 4-epimerase
MTMAYILITGAHGFIGRHLALRLASKGHIVGGIGHGNWSEAEAMRWGLAEWIYGDIDVNNLRTMQNRVAPDLVYHLAGGSTVGFATANPRLDFYRTVGSTVDLLEWIRLYAPSARLIAVSSAAVYGACQPGQIPEDAFLQPYSPYGHHKQIMESLCRSYSDSYGLKITVARLFSVFGACLKKQLLWDICNRLAAGESPIRLGGSGNELRDWTDVREVAMALEFLSTLRDPAIDVINIGTGVATSVQKIAFKLIDIWQRTEPGSRDVLFSGSARPGDPFSLVADPRRLQSLGFSWRLSLDQGLADYIEWFRSRIER